MIRDVVVFVVLPVPVYLDQSPGIGGQDLKEYGLFSPAVIKLSTKERN